VNHANRFYDGEVCSILERSERFGPISSAVAGGRGIPFRERYCFFKHQPVIKAELEFDFNGDEVGDSHIEETKLNGYYPTARLCEN